MVLSTFFTLDIFRKMYDIPVAYCGSISCVEVSWLSVRRTANWDPDEVFILFQSPFIFSYLNINCSKQASYMFMIKSKDDIINKECSQGLYNCHQTIIKYWKVTFWVLELLWLSLWPLSHCMGLHRYNKN